MSGYEVAHVDELDVMPVNGGEFVWRPVRRRFGISAFGSNAYSAEKAGFFVFPADPNSNNIRVYVLRAATKQVKLGPAAEELVRTTPPVKTKQKPAA